MATQDLTPSEVKALLPLLQKMNKLTADTAKSAQQIFMATKGTAFEAKGEKLIRTEIAKQYANEYATLANIAKISTDLYKKEKDRLKNLIDLDTTLEKQETILHNINKENEKSLKIQNQEIDIMRKKGSMLRAHMAEIALNARRNFQTESGHTTASSIAQGSANAAVGAHGAANDPASVLSSLGPWGVLAKIILDVIDGARILGATLQKSAAASGHFVDSVESSRKESQNLFSQQTALMTNYGVTVEEVSQIYQDLRSTGIAALGVIPETGDAMTQLAQDTMAFAKASNQSTAQVAGQFAALMRTNRQAKSQLEASYRAIYSAAERMARDGAATIEESIQSIFSLNEQFKSMGLNVQSISSVVEGVSKALKDLKQGGGIDAINKISSGIINLSNASEGWKVLMGKFSGMGGDFLDTLYRVQQRGEDMMNPKADTYNAQKDIAMFNQMAGKIAGRTPDKRMGQFLTEKMGEGMGLDRQTVQVMQKMRSGAISQDQGLADMKAIRDATKEQNMSSKSMFDILRQILLGMIAKPIIGIWKLVAGWRGDQASAAMAASAEGAVNQAIDKSSSSESLKGRDAAGFLGGTTARSGAIRNAGAGGPGSPGSSQSDVKVTIVYDKDGVARLMTEQQKKAKKTAIETVHKQQTRNTSGKSN